MDREEMLSVTWDAFCFCLNSYNNLEVPFPSHFTRNINFFLIRCIKRKSKQAKKGMIEYNGDVILEDNLPDFDETEVKVVNSKFVLSVIRENIKEHEYRKIFDDAVSGRSLGSRIRGITAYKRTKYNEAKKVFKLVIKALIEM